MSRHLLMWAASSSAALLMWAGSATSGGGARAAVHPCLASVFLYSALLSVNVCGLFASYYSSHLVKLLWCFPFLRPPWRVPKCCSLGTTAARPRAAEGASRSVAASPTSPRVSRGASSSSPSSRPRRCSASPPRSPARARTVAAAGSCPAAAERRHRGSRSSLRRARRRRARPCGRSWRCAPGWRSRGTSVSCS